MPVFENSFSKLSIKWQLLVICIFLVSVPTSVLGIMIYDTLRAEAVTTVEDRLKIAVTDWRTYATKGLSWEPATASQGWLLGELGAQRLFDVGYFWVVDGQGRYVLSPGRQHDGEDLMGEKDAFGEPFIASMLKEAQTSRQGAVGIRYYDWPGERFGSAQKVAAFTWLADRQWLLVASSPYDDNVTSMGRIRDLVVLVSLAAVVLGSLVGYLFALLLTLPLLRLEKYVSRIAAGDTSVKVDAELKAIGSEVGSLARSFDAMAVSLDEKVQRLETQGAELLKSELSLKQERDFTKAVISSTVVGMIVVDRGERISLCNQAAAAALGLKTDTCQGRLFSETVMLRLGAEGRDEGKSLETVSLALKDGQIARLNVEDGYYCVIAKNSDAPLTPPFPIALVVAPLRGHDNAIEGAVIAFQDATEAKTLEDARKSFISVASHQLRTPITTLRWFIDAIIKDDDGRLSAEQKESLNDMRSVTDRMNSLVKMLLQIARVEMGRLRIEPKPTDFTRLTRDVVASLQPELDYKAQTVQVTSVPDELPHLLMDPDVVWQVVLNLLTNANRYSPNSSVIEVSLKLRDQESDVLFTIRDHGIGIPADQRKRLFTKFFRADNAIASVSYGSGLGLNFAKQLVEGWGGRIWFESVEGSGSTFYFTFPLVGMKPRAGEVKIDA